MSNIDEILNSIKTDNTNTANTENTNTLENPETLQNTTGVETNNTSKLESTDTTNSENIIEILKNKNPEERTTEEMVALFKEMERQHKVNIADFDRIIVPEMPDIPGETLYTETGDIANTGNTSKLDSNDIANSENMQNTTIVETNNTTKVDSNNTENTNIQNVDFNADPYKNPFYDRNLGFPYKYEIQERYKFLYDDYLFRIPFSKSMPKDVYEGVLGWEIYRKIVDANNYKIPFKQAFKNVTEAISLIKGSRDINHILKVFNRYKFPIKKTDFKDIPYKEETYDTFPIGEVFKDKLPENTAPEEIKEYNEIKNLILNYKTQRDLGYYSPEGRIFAKDLQKVPDDISPIKIRNSEWLMFQNIEKWEERVKVIRKQTMSLAEAKEKGIYDADRKAEEERWRSKQHTFRAHPTDPNFVYIDENLCERIEVNKPQYANQTEKYPFKRDPGVLTIEEKEDLDNQYVNEVLTFEEELKDLKRNFKDRREYYKMNGVKVIQIDKAVRKLKTEIRKNPQMEKEVDEIYAKLVGNSEVMNRLTMLNIA